MNDRVAIRKIPTGVQGLDEVLGGGLPEFSFNLVAGGPGCGKTTMAHQIMFANAAAGRKALYFTIVGEPPLKMLRYQQQFSFFDAAQVNETVRFIHLGKELVEGGLAPVLDRITKEVEAASPAIVVVDSFRSLVRGEDDDIGLQRFVQLLAINLASYEATTFLVGEYLEHETNSNPIFTVADGIVWLSQHVVGNSVVRRLQVLKIRGQKQSPGLHTFALNDDGMRVFPRLPAPEERRGPEQSREARKKTGVGGLDEMLGGGIPVGYSVLLTGPSGSGKSALATQFLVEGVKLKEPGVIAVFDRRPENYLKTAGRALAGSVDEGKVKVVYLRPLDLSVDEIFEQIREAVIAMGAKRLVIDSLSALELALAQAFRVDFRESLYRMIGALTGLGVTVLLTAEVVDCFTELRLGPEGASFLTDGIILQRYVEMDGALRRAMAVVKLRAHQHSKELRRYEISDKGIMLGDVLEGYSGILTGRAISTGPSGRKKAKKKRGR